MKSKNYIYFADLVKVLQWKDVMKGVKPVL
jgi:hypothetical protein